jgi:hypothetical protein
MSVTVGSSVILSGTEVMTVRTTPALSFLFNMDELTTRCFDHHCDEKDECLRFLLRKSGKVQEPSCRPKDLPSHELCPFRIGTTEY